MKGVNVSNIEVSNCDDVSCLEHLFHSKQVRRFCIIRIVETKHRNQDVKIPTCFIGILYVPYILESNSHPFYSFRELKNQMRIIIACGLDSRSRAGFWKNDRATVRAVRKIQYSNLLFYLLLIIIIYYSSDSPLSLITESLSVLRRDCARLLRKTRFTVPV